MDKDYKVGIQCMTYNHSKYIAEALNGFVIQKTNFPFVILLVDDASTDGTSEIIRSYINERFSINDISGAYIKETEYAQVLYARHNTNENCYIVFIGLKYNHYQIGRKKDKLKYLEEWINSSEFIALCEGDDYWTDSHKLQKQIDFLENHPDYTMCFHNATEHYENSVRVDRAFSHVRDKDYLGHYLFRNWIIPTASVVFRRNVYNSNIYLKVLESPNFIYGDTPLFCACAYLGKIRGMSDNMSIYRRHIGGMTFNSEAASGFRVVRHQQEFYNIFGSKYKAPLLISYYYSRSLIKKIMKFEWGKCREILNAYPYKEYIALSVIITPFMYLKDVMKNRWGK